MKSLEFLSKIYKDGQSVLRCPLLRAFVTIFSHGFTHFLALAFFCTIAVLMYNQNKHHKITPHYLGINIGRMTDFDTKHKNERRIQIGDVCININLNSRTIANQTGGKYHNGIEIEFNGDSLYVNREYKHYVRHAGNNEVQQIGEERFVDSVFVSVFNNVPFEEYKFTGSSSMVLNKTFDNPKKDSIGTPVVYISDDDNTDLSMHTIKSEKNVATVEIEPKPRDVNHTINFYSDEIGVGAQNPYYYYYIAFPKFNFKGDLKIRFSISEIVEKREYNLTYCESKNLQYNYLYPEPDVVGNGWLEYNSGEKKELIRRNHGIVIQAVDIDQLNKQNQRGFLFSVFVGTCVAFILDIIVQLIREMRRLQRRKE